MSKNFWKPIHPFSSHLDCYTWITQSIREKIFQIKNLNIGDFLYIYIFRLLVASSKLLDYPKFTHVFHGHTCKAQWGRLKFSLCRTKSEPILNPPHQLVMGSYLRPGLLTKQLWSHKLDLRGPGLTRVGGARKERNAWITSI